MDLFLRGGVVVFFSHEILHDIFVHSTGLKNSQRAEDLKSFKNVRAFFASLVPKSLKKDDKMKSIHERNEVVKKDAGTKRRKGCQKFNRKVNNICTFLLKNRVLVEETTLPKSFIYE